MRDGDLHVTEFALRDKLVARRAQRETLQRLAFPAVYILAEWNARSETVETDMRILILSGFMKLRQQSGFARTRTAYKERSGLKNSGDCYTDAGSSGPARPPPCNK